MRGFLLGVILTALVGGLFYHLGYGYGTVSACKALQTALVRDVTRSVQGDLRQSLGDRVPPQLGEMFLQPLTEPLIHQRVESYLADRNWFQCAGDLLRLDILGDQGPVEAVRSVTVRL